MKNFSCTACSNKVYFENVQCLRCNHALGYDVGTARMVALSPVGESPGQTVGNGVANPAAASHVPIQYRRVESAVAGGEAGVGELVMYCANSAHGVCNWLTSAIPASGEENLCIACELNRIIPNLDNAGSLEAWRDLELSKKRLVYSLLRFGLPLQRANGGAALQFDFVANATTGHLDGLITIDIMEADAVERERQRQFFAEPYRSLLGHLRHESGHFYWMVLVEDAGRQDEFRRVFGDERQNYGEALSRHHANGVPPDWQDRYVSAYASSHPWEDWAETFAHYLHLVDSVDTAEAEGMEPRAAGLIFGALWPFKAYDLYREESFDALMERWIPLTLALNAMNRSMGHADFYPFVIPAAAYEKLAFVHRLIREHRTGRPDTVLLEAVTGMQARI